MGTDKRIIKTRSAIKTAFMALMLDKDINKITVSDIAESALVNRSTFYLHYADVNAVMADIENEIAVTVSDCFSQFDARNVYESIYALFTNLTGILADREAIRKFILYSTNSQYIIERLKNIFVDKAMCEFKKSNPGLSEEKYFYGLTFLTSGIIDTYIKWSYAEQKSITLEELCRRTGELAEAIVNKLTEN